VGKTDGIHKAYRELTPPSRLPKRCQKWYFADLLAKKNRTYTSIRFQLAKCQWTVPAMHVWPDAKMDVSAGIAAAT
jgi:hypothetical protein